MREDVQCKWLPTVFNDSPQQNLPLQHFSNLPRKNEDLLKILLLITFK